MLSKIVKLLLEEGISQVRIEDGELYFIKYVNKSTTEYVQVDAYDINKSIIVALQQNQK